MLTLLILIITSVSIPIDSWQNEIVEELQVRGATFTNFPSLRPYDIDPLDSTFVPEGVPWLGERLRMPLLEIVGQSDTATTLKLKPALYYEWSDWTAFVQGMIKFGEDNYPPYYSFENLFSVDYERGYIKFGHPNFSAFAGRDRLAIGPSPRYNLLLSGYSPPLDWLNLSCGSEKVRFSFYFSRLDDMYTKPLEFVGDTITQKINARRYLTIRRLDFSPTPYLNLSFSEGAVFGGENYTLYPYYFTPVLLVGAYQLNTPADGNIFLNLDGRLYWDNFSLYGSLLVDDFQIIPDPNNEPNHLGINLGFEVVDPFGLDRTFWLFEYTALTRWTYNSFAPYERYTYISFPLGPPSGTDFSEIYGKGVYHLNPRCDVFGEMSFLRKGESSITTIWPIPEHPRVPGTSFPDDNFLSGITQNSLNFSLGIRFFRLPYFAGDLSVGYTFINNYRHIANETKWFPSVRVRVSLIK